MTPNPQHDEQKLKVLNRLKAWDEDSDVESFLALTDEITIDEMMCQFMAMEILREIIKDESFDKIVSDVTGFILDIVEKEIASAVPYFYKTFGQIHLQSATQLASMYYRRTDANLKGDARLTNRWITINKGKWLKQKGIEYKLSKEI